MTQASQHLFPNSISYFKPIQANLDNSCKNKGNETGINEKKNYIVMVNGGKKKDNIPESGPVSL